MFNISSAHSTRIVARDPPYRAPAWLHEPAHRATAELIASGAAKPDYLVELYKNSFKNDLQLVKGDDSCTYRCRPVS
jgi:hypothetical protein